MSQSLTSLSPTKLKELKSGDTVSILYKEHQNAESSVLREGLPKKIATTFSTKWKDEFLPINKLKVADLRKFAAKNQITIVGGNKVIHKNILDWMISCCEGKGIRHFDNPPFKVFAYLYFARNCAAIIGCEYLEKNIMKRMDGMAVNQIHSEDVRMLWLQIPPDLEMQKVLAEHVAVRFWNKTLKANGSYRTLREEIPSFNKAIDEILNAKKARGEKSPPNPVRKYGVSGRYRVAQKMTTATAKTTPQAENGTKVVVVKAEVVRQGTQGRPTYAKLDLETVGVTKEQYSKRE
ncbi:hypothetical protein LTR99_006503 [Exophiala xenobiotica]|uniref:Uncharacterized protein n=1 Tax=Vermiconidia calcicola TaxID=1690605 RepID=A0AAV9Q9L7_9PEZI|nr:hypothetical protein LTR40_007511 [Exophiala xenobiotica]KAK5535610.1 hypothetical protein LTR23_008204 [Chaetothyriales sp. CCFEE 6169]KAK5537673.1 hypothetical protein LTR25_004925 [Vermiconidia calcicola]KAK5267316.1 hypothetical protein LTR96_007349 [Exophiala xenobiotica]KAK5301536.1 hypothetical protein LTR99_006503 [Exophiala xenobiotica]